MEQCVDCGVMKGFGHSGRCASRRKGGDDSPKPRPVYRERVPVLGKDGLPVYPYELSTSNGWSSESFWPDRS